MVLVSVNYNYHTKYADQLTLFKLKKKFVRFQINYTIYILIQINTKHVVERVHSWFTCGYIGVNFRRNAFIHPLKY